MLLKDLSESEGQFGNLDSEAVYSLANPPFSLKSHCHPLPLQEPLFLGRQKVSDYFVEISALDSSRVDNMDSDENLNPLLLRCTPKTWRPENKKRKNLG